MPRGIPNVKGEQKPRTGLFVTSPGMHSVVWERDKEMVTDPVESLIERGYKIVTDDSKNRGRAEIPIEEFQRREKAQHERCAALERGRSANAGVKETVVVQKPVTLADFAQEDAEYEKAAKEAGISEDES